MKKFLCVLFAAALLLTCFTGCKKNTDKDVSSTLEIAQQILSGLRNEFEKPEDYASVVTVTINPEFRLYLDVDGVVLAVEPVNSDAKTIERKISFKDQKVDTVVGVIIEAANDGGFVKTDANINIVVTEVVDETMDVDGVLDEIRTSANNKFDELKIEATVKIIRRKTVVLETPNDNTTSISEDATSSKQNSTTSESKKLGPAYTYPHHQEEAISSKEPSENREPSDSREPDKSNESETEKSDSEAPLIFPEGKTDASTSSSETKPSAPTDRPETANPGTANPETANPETANPEATESKNSGSDSCESVEGDTSAEDAVHDDEITTSDEVAGRDDSADHSEQSQTDDTTR